MKKAPVVDEQQLGVVDALKLKEAEQWAWAHVVAR